MNNEINKGMGFFKKAFIILAILDFIGLVLAGIALFPTFKMLADYGRLMLVIASIMMVIALAVMFFEILAKIFLIRSTAPAFSWESGRKGYVALARLIFFFNLAAAIISLLSAGGEGATLQSQINTYLRLATSVAEIIIVLFYLGAVKRIRKALSDKNQ